jgi:ribose-phosphate pyrophosphokinase
MFSAEDRRCLFSGNAATRLATRVAEELGEELAPAFVGKWANGETRVQLQANVRGADVFVFQSFPEDVNDRLMELLLIIDAALRASAGRITVVAPYLPYSKQEKKVRGREPIAAKVLANLLRVTGAQRVVAMDLHERAIQGFYDMPFDHLTALGVLADHLRGMGYGNGDSVVIAPDEGAVEKAVILAQMLEANVAVVFKRHPKDDPEAVETAGFVGDVAGKRSLIVDDMILGGSTLANAAGKVIEAGASEVSACITHAVLCGDALERLEDCPLKRLIVTDSTLPERAYDHPKIEVASVASLLAQAISRIHSNESVSALLPKEA